MTKNDLKVGDLVFHKSSPKEVGVIKQITLSKINNYSEPLVFIQYSNINTWVSATSKNLKKVVIT